MKMKVGGITEMPIIINDWSVKPSHLSFWHSWKKQ